MRWKKYIKTHLGVVDGGVRGIPPSTFGRAAACRLSRVGRVFELFRFVRGGYKQEEFKGVLPLVYVETHTRHFVSTDRRPRRLGGLSSCLLKSISRVRFSPSAHNRWDVFMHKKQMISGSTRARVRDNRRNSTSSGNAEPYARKKMKASTGGEKGRHP